jgi:hypothetical protein
MHFLEVLKSLSVNSALPFNLDFTLKPRGVNAKTITTSFGLEIPIYGALLVREKTFLESYLLDINKKRNQVEQAIERLAYQLNKELSLSSMVLARAAVNGEAPADASAEVLQALQTLLKSDDYQSWKACNIETFANLLEQIAGMSSETTRDFFIITIFLVSRTYGAWDLSDTMGLTVAESEEILALFYKEVGANNEETIVAPAPDEVIDLGKG